jgi:hypothetical protein
MTSPVAAEPPIPRSEREAGGFGRRIHLSLQGSYNTVTEKLEDKVSVMSEGIFIDVDGIRIEGEILHRSRADIAVRIVSPYQGITTGLHIPYFGMANPANDFRGPRGDCTAAQLLDDLYRLCTHVEKNREVLKIRVAEMDLAIENLDRDRFLPESAFRQIRADLRSQLRSGRIDNKVYQQRLVQARKGTQERQREIRRLEEDFFKANFPMIVPVGTRDEVLTVLRTSP